MRGAPRAAAVPVAKASRVSDVEVSPSMVTALKLSTTPSARRRCSAGAAIGASVNTKASMVAMSGAIMPAPLAMPQMVTVVLPIFASAVAPLGKVSVVMMALAAASQFPGAAAATRPSMTPSKARASSGSPMTPVEARKTSTGRQPAAFDAMSAVSLVASRPLRPVKALALPELTTRTLARPALIWSRHQSTGADGHFDRVKTPATVVPGSNRATRTSVRPL